MKDSRKWLFNPFVIFILIFLLGGCQSNATKEELISYVSNPINGLKRMNDVSDLRFELQYKPLSLIHTKEMIDNDAERVQYYDLRISTKTEGSDVTNFRDNSHEGVQSMLQYLSFGLKNDIKLVQGNDTLNTMLYHFERSYDMVPYRTFVLAFEDNGNNEDRKLIIDSPVLGADLVKIGIRGADISRIPELKL